MDDAEKKTKIECMLDASSFSMSADITKVVDAKLHKTINALVGTYNYKRSYNNKYCYFKEKNATQKNSSFLFWSDQPKNQGWWVCPALDGQDYYALSPLGLAG